MGIYLKNYISEVVSKDIQSVIKSDLFSFLKPSTEFISYFWKWSNIGEHISFWVQAVKATAGMLRINRNCERKPSKFSARAEM